jgi:hypothetical protein
MKVTPKTSFRVVVKSNKIMGDYIAMHSLVPQNEFPVRLRRKIPKNEIWIREDIYKNTNRRQAVLRHERNELRLMKERGLTYKQAHKRAQVSEKSWWLTDKKRDLKRYLRKKIR